MSTDCYLTCTLLVIVDWVRWFYAPNRKGNYLKKMLQWIYSVPSWKRISQLRWEAINQSEFCCFICEWAKMKHSFVASIDQNHRMEIIKKLRSNYSFWYHWSQKVNCSFGASNTVFVLIQFMAISCNWEPSTLAFSFSQQLRRNSTFPVPQFRISLRNTFSFCLSYFSTRVFMRSDYNSKFICFCLSWLPASCGVFECFLGHFDANDVCRIGGFLFWIFDFYWT